MKKLSKIIYVVMVMFLVGLAGSFAGSNSASAEVTLGTPAGLKQTDASSTSVDIAWTPVLGADVEGYKIYLSTDNVNFTYQKFDSHANACVDGLTSGQTYYFKVSAVNEYIYSNDDLSKKEYVEGALSGSCVVYTKPEAPANVTNAKQTAATTNSVTIEWLPVAGASSYNIKKWDGTSNFIANVATTSYTVTGLAPGNDYTYEIYAVSQNGTYTKESSWKTVYTSTLAERVTDVRCTGYIYDGVTLAWSSLTPKASFEVAIYDYTGALAITKQVSDTQCTVYGYGACTFAVRPCVSADGTMLYGDWSNVGSAVPSTSISVTKKTNTSKIIKWSKVKGATSYSIYRSLKKNSKFKKIATVKASKDSYVSKKLKKNKKYYYYIVVNSQLSGTTYKSAKSNTVGHKK